MGCTESSNSKTGSHGISPIRIIDYDSFKNRGEFPRYPEDKALSVTLDSTDTNTSFNVFISHCWIAGWDGSESWRGRPHPDNLSNDKYKLCVDGILKIWNSSAPALKHCHIWLDFGCINQDGDPAGELKMLDKIVQWSDVIFTPIVDNEGGWDLLTSANLFSDYRAPAWNQGDHSYLNRCWCRAEMMYAAMLPLLSNDTERITNMRAGLRHAHENGRRLHVLYGTREFKTNVAPWALPPLQYTYFKEFNPLLGLLSKEQDRSKIEYLINELKPYIKEIDSNAYAGEVDEAGNPHGRGELSYTNGEIYEGEFVHGLREGRGKMTYATGAVCVGDFQGDKLDGPNCEMYYANGDIYIGGYKGGSKFGIGKYTYADGVIYEGAMG